jgi:membrane peptidoglycan carboxypeptidase
MFRQCIPPSLADLARLLTAEALVRRLARRTPLDLRRPGERLRGMQGRMCALAGLGLFLLVGVYEARTSAIQSFVLSHWAGSLSYAVMPGPSGHIAFPESGPFDERRGYSRIPEFAGRLEAHGYRVTEQARQSPDMMWLVRRGIAPPYREPAAAGLVIRDRAGTPLHDARPLRVQFRNFEEVPPLLVSTLLFIENRELASLTAERANPAVDWRRLVKAGALYAGSKLGMPVRLEGGSTLATQMEKYRHSAHGRTASPLDKLRQMTAASLKAYRDGPDTRAERRQIVVDYLNTMPLAAAPGHGEIYGLGEGLQAWFGMDLDAVARALAAPGAGREKARAFKHALALLYAVRAPTYYLVEHRGALEERVRVYGDLLLGAGVIDRDLHRQMRAVPLAFAARAAAREAAFAERRAARAVREELRRLLGLRGYYELDRLHLEAETTVDGGVQAAATRLFRDLARPEFVRAQGLAGEHLLSAGDPRRVGYSLLLFERTPGGNVLRVQADNLDRPFDINSGMKLELGSTAKLRTLAHYLEIVAELHGELAGLPPAALARRAAAARDPLTRWAAETLRLEPDLTLAGLLDRALERTYAASPNEVFFTGGGVHAFENFHREDDGRVLTVRDGFVRSVNLVYIRLMRDLVRYHEARLGYDARAVLSDPEHPERRRLLREIAGEEARHSLWRAYRDYRGLAPDGALRRLLKDRAGSPRHLAIVFSAWHPGAGPEALHRWLSARLPGTSAEEAERLHRAYGNPRLTIADYGHLLGRHPLEVWTAGELIRHPGLTWEGLLGRSEEARRAASAWLFQTRHRAAQDLRLRARIERDAFARMTPSWRRLGFPFEQLVPSLATAIGSSSDRPAALAELMGIIVNDGMRRPTRVIERLRFAPDTPYHTVFEAEQGPGERVMPAPVARALREVLAQVVEEGTGRRLRGAFRAAGDVPVEVGGKTGSGDNRFETFARGGRRLASRAVSRTGAFVFYIGDRYFGVVTASVEGAGAASYGFTSALPVSVLRLLAPEINARLGG